MNNKIIQFICPDQKGIIAQITSILYDAHNNILSIEQHVDNENNNFYIRIVVEHTISSKFPENNLHLLSKKLNGEINIFDSNQKINVAILGTKESEPIYDLFIKHTSNALYCNTPILISNHNELSYIANQFNTTFYKSDRNQ